MTITHDFSKIWYEWFERDYCVNAKKPQKNGTYFLDRLNLLFAYCDCHEIDKNDVMRSQYGTMGNVVHYLIKKLRNPRYFWTTSHDPDVNFLYTYHNGSNEKY